MSSEERVLSDLVWTPERGTEIPEVRGISWENFLLSDDKYLGKWKTDSGIRVTPETALQSTVVLACCRILAETVSGLPIHVYRRNPDGGDEIAKEIPLYKILTFRPNEWQTKAEFFEQIMMNLTLWGNSYTRVRSGQYGSVSSLDNLHPSRMDVERLENGRLRYSYTDPETGRLERYTQDQIMHIRWTPEQDGIKGMVPVEIAREAIGLARACEQHAARFWANSARPGVVLQTEGTLNAEAAERLRDNWERLHRGSERAFKTAVLTGGMKAVELGMTNESSQFVASRDFQTSEICRVYRIAQHLIQGTPGGDLEVQGQEFVTYTLMPWLNRIESSISRSLIYNDDEYYAKFDVRGLLRANSQQRASYYSTMTGLGIMTINDCRRAEGLKPLGPIGDHHFVAMNTQTLEEATKPKPEAPPAGGMPGMPGGGGGGDGPPPPTPGGPPSLPEVKTGKAPTASPKGEASTPKAEPQPQMEEAVEEASAEWEDAVEGRAFCATGEGGGIDNSCGANVMAGPDKDSGGGVAAASGGPVTASEAKEKFERYRPFESVGNSKNSDFIRVPSDEEISSALKENDVQQSKIGASRQIPENTPVALRIDIPAWTKSEGKTYVVTVHEGKNPDNKKSFGPVLGYDAVARLSGPVRFSANDEDRAQQVAEGKSKTPLATVNGSFSQSREIPSDIDSWTPVGYDPQKAVYFYDKTTGQEVKGGTDALSVGNTVFTRQPQYGPRNAKTHYRSADEMFATDSWGLESRSLSAANQDLYVAQEEIAEENGKWPQSDAHYMDKNPFASRGMKCSNCVYFEEGQCEIVQGSVSPDGICKLWIIPEEKLSSPEQRGFCATGPGGGIDNSCGGKSSAGGDESDKSSGGGKEKEADFNAVANEILRSIDATGGYSVHPITAESPTTGYMVATVPNAEEKIDGLEAVTEDRIRQYFDKHVEYLSKNPDLHLGGWFNLEDGKVYLDLSQRFESIDDAIDAAVDKKQLAIWDLNTKSEIRQEHYDARRTRPKESRSVRLSARCGTEGDSGSDSQGGIQAVGRESREGEGCCGHESGIACQVGDEGRAFCPTGEGQGVDNSCGSGSGTSSVDNSWKKAGREYTFTPGEGKSPIVGGDDIKSLSIEGPKEVASAMKGMKVKSLTDVVSIGGGLTRGAFTSVVANGEEIHVMSEVPIDPDNEESGSMSSTISLGVDPEGKKYVDYGTMHASTDAGTANLTGEDAARMSSILLEKFPESLAAAEKSGFDYAQTFAMGSSEDEFKGYRLWPQFGFDAEIYSDIRDNIPKDVVPHDDPVTVQELISTPAGKKWWNENGESMAMTLSFKDKKSAGYKRFKDAIKLAARLKKRNEGRSLYDYLVGEERGFCATGPGGGIDNSCGGSSGVAMAPDRDMGSSVASPSAGAGKPASVTVESQDSLDKAMSVLGVGSVEDVVTISGGNVRGAKVDVYADPSGFTKVSAIWPIDKEDPRGGGKVFTEVSMANTSEGKVLGFEAFGPTEGSVGTGASQTKVMSIISEKVAESIEAAEKHGFVAVTTFAVGDANNQYKGYRLWPQFGFDADLPRDLAKRVPPEIVLKSKGIEIPPAGSTSIPQHLVVKSLASQHRDLTIQELISTREGDRWWDEHGDDIELKLDLTDKSSLGYKKWQGMRDRLPRLKARNETRAFFDAFVEGRDADCGRTPDGKFGSNNKCQEDGDGAATATATAGSSSVEEPASGSSRWKAGDAIPDAFQAVSSAKPVSRDESGDITTEVFDRADISPFAGQQFVSPIACGRYLAEMTAQTRGEAIDSKKPLSEESMSFLVESMVQQVESAEGRGYTPAFYSDQERQAQLEAYSKIHPILRGGRTASGLCIGQEDEDGNCVQGDSITPEGEFLFRAVQAMTSPQASPLPNMQRADEVLTNFFENPDPSKAALGAGSVAGNASKVAKANLARLQKIIDKVGLTEAANIFSQPPVRAGDLDDFFEEKLGLKGFKAGGYSVDQVVPMFSVFGPKVGPFFANNNGDHEALTADVWFSRTWGRLTGELVQETNPKLAKDHADVLSRRMRYVTDEDLQGTSREDFASAVEQMEKTGEIPASVAAWAEARSKRYGKEGFNKGVKGVRDKEVARLSIAILNNLVSTLDDPGTTVRRSNMIDVISEVSRRTGHPPAFVQDLLWQDEQDIWAAAGARTSTDVGEASLYSTGIDKMVANPMMRFPVKKAAEAEKKKSKSSKARKRSIDVESRDYEDDIDSGRGWLEQLSFDMETEDVSPDEFADAFIEFASSLPRGGESEDRSALESARDAVVELRSAGLTTVVMPNAGREGLHVMGFDADIPKDLAETLPETLSHCKTLLDLHVSSEGRSWWEQNGRDIDVAIDLDGVQGQIFDGFANGKTFSDILEEGILDDYGNS